MKQKQETINSLQETLESREQFKAEKELIEKNNKLVEKLSKYRKREQQLKAQLAFEQQNNAQRVKKENEHNEFNDMMNNLDQKRKHLIDKLEDNESESLLRGLTPSDKK